jgi:hypothetical protein
MRGILYKLLPILLVSGCMTAQPGIRTEIVEKPVIQVQKCIKISDVPVRPRPLKDEPKPSDLESALSTALVKISEWTRYGNKTDEIIKNCE